MKLSRSDTAFLKAQGVARLATVGNGGTLHNVPVCPLVDGGKFYFASETNARKMKNLRANPRATIVFDMYRDSWKGLRGLMLVCTARTVDAPEIWAGTFLPPLLISQVTSTRPLVLPIPMILSPKVFLTKGAWTPVQWRTAFAWVMSGRRVQSSKSLIMDSFLRSSSASQFHSRLVKAIGASDEVAKPKSC